MARSGPGGWAARSPGCAASSATWRAWASRRCGSARCSGEPRRARRRGGRRYHGYATRDFLAVEPRFGDAEALRDLVAAAHAAGLR